MTKLLAEVMRKVSTLPKKRQEDAAHVLLTLIENESSPYHLTDAQVAEVERRMKKKDRKFITLAQARKRLRHFGV